MPNKRTELSLAPLCITFRQYLTVLNTARLAGESQQNPARCSNAASPVPPPAVHSSPSRLHRPGPHPGCYRQLSCRLKALSYLMSPLGCRAGQSPRNPPHARGAAERPGTRVLIQPPRPGGRWAGAVLEASAVTRGGKEARRREERRPRGGGKPAVSARLPTPPGGRSAAERSAARAAALPADSSVLRQRSVCT